jgi:hypothetical protein
MTNVEGMTKLKWPNDDIGRPSFPFGIRILVFFRHWDLVIRHSSFALQRFHRIDPGFGAIRFH